MIRLLGAIIIVAGCAGIGFSMAAAQHRQEQDLRRMITALELMQWELRCRMTPLPELCKMGADAAGGEVGKALENLARELDTGCGNNVEDCMDKALGCSVSLPPLSRHLLRTLGRTLGKFDLEGQLEGLASSEKDCSRELDKLTTNKEQRLRSYQTLSLCAGAALAILLI